MICVPHSLKAAKHFFKISVGGTTGLSQKPYQLLECLSDSNVNGKFQFGCSMFMQENVTISCYQAQVS